MINKSKKIKLDFYNQGLTEPFFACGLEKSICEFNRPFLMAITLEDVILAGRDLTYSNHYIENNRFNIPFVRFMGTGGPVHFSPNMLKITGYIPKGISNLASTCDMIVDIFARLDITAEHTPDTNDIKINGKKVVGVTHATPLGDYNFIGFFFALDNDYEKAREAMILTKHTSELSERSAGIHETHPNITKEQIIDAVILEFEARNFTFKNTSVGEKLSARALENEQDIFRNETFIKHGYVDKP